MPARIPAQRRRRTTPESHLAHPGTRHGRPGPCSAGFRTPGLAVRVAGLLAREPAPGRGDHPGGAHRAPVPVHRLPEDF